MTSFLDRVRAAASGIRPLFTPPKQKLRHSIETIRLDERVYAEAREVPLVDDLVTDLLFGDGEREEFPAAPELVRDIFMALFKAVPDLVDRRQVDPEVYPARKIVEEILDNPKLQELHEVTATDPVMSTVALEAMKPHLIEAITRLPPPPPPPQPKPQPQEQQEKQEKQEKQEDGGGQQPQDDGDQEGENGAGDEGDQGENGDPGDGEGDGQDAGEGEGDGQDGDAQSEAEAEAQAEADWQAAYDELVEDLDLDQVLNKALEAAAEEAADLDTLRAGIGLEDGEWKTMSPAEKLAKAQQLRTPHLRAIADVLGRLKRISMGVRAQRIVNVPQEPWNVKLGNDVRHALPSQFALLANPVAKYEFYRRFAESQLLQFDLRGTEDAGKGPVVVCIDKSASMNGPKGTPVQNRPFTWAMGVAEALRRFADDDGRDYHAIFFGNNNDRHRFDFPKGKGPFEKVLAFLSCDANGGTQFDGVLDEAIRTASTAFDGEGRGKADIVFITDGRANLTDEWIAAFNAEKIRTGVRLFSIYIGGAADMTRENSPVKLLERFSDLVISAAELKPESANQVFALV